MPTAIMSTEDLVRDEVKSWEATLGWEFRSDLRLRGGLIACILRWRVDAQFHSDLERQDRCNSLLAMLSIP